MKLEFHNNLFQKQNIKLSNQNIKILIKSSVKHVNDNINTYYIDEKDFRKSFYFEKNVIELGSQLNS